MSRTPQAVLEGHDLYAIRVKVKAAKDAMRELMAACKARNEAIDEAAFLLIHRPMNRRGKPPLVHESGAFRLPGSDSVWSRSDSDPIQLAARVLAQAAIESRMPEEFPWAELRAKTDEEFTRIEEAKESSNG
ncbi:hypothetical protein ABZ840_10275 [Streptomyces sp. NPDC047117]|uniref:hypothetical protein n=1 Tax=Streptomyces sp. NPDC047117 TaxID=3155379 RepID=UPI003408791C